jgi:GntR family transcriptional regulator/MocR family aminotransferase
LPQFPREAVRFDLGIGVPDVSRFPWKVWRRLAWGRLRSARDADNSYISAEGYLPLRKAIANVVGFSRAVHCGPNDVLITNGAQQAIQLVAQVMLVPGTTVAMEEPGYPMARWIFMAQGAKIVDVPVDGDGLIVERVPAHAKLVYTTPSHQFPTGAVMSFERRVRLLEWARKRGAAIIEDDYDSEFRFDGRPLESLQSVDPSVVIYVGTFSKSLFPGIRIGFVVAPQPLRPALTVAKQLSDWHSPFWTQATAAAFIAEGHYRRHIRRMRRVYSERRTRLLAELQRALSDHLEVLPSETGLHVAARLKGPIDPDTIANAALTAGVGLLPMPGGLTFGIGPIETADIPQAIGILRDTIRSHAHRTSSRRTRNKNSNGLR